MNILHIASGLPNEAEPFRQPFIQTQIESLADIGINSLSFEVGGYESGLNYLTSYKRLKNEIQNSKIDIAHVHYSYCMIPLILANVKIPIVLSLMGSDLLGDADRNGAQTIRGRFDRILTKFLINYSDLVVVKSDEMKSKVIKNKPIHVIPNGVDMSKFKPANQQVAREKLKLGMDKFFVLFLGDKNLYRKNYQLAYESVEHFNDIEQDQIEIINPYGISQEKVIEYMNACDVLMLTSYWEGSPNVIKEAMSCNLPIISTNVGDVAEIIGNTYNCYVAGFNISEISSCLKKIVLKRERTNGREKIMRLDKHNIARKLEDIYKSLL